MIINVAFASDDNYAQHLCVALYSLLLNSSVNDFYSIFIIDAGIMESHKRKIDESLVEFKNYKITYILENKEKFKENQKILHVSLTTYSRLLLADYLPKIENVIYLDSDILVMENIRNIYYKNNPNYLLYAAKIFHPNYESVMTRHYRKKFKFCFNAGVLLMNLSLFRKNNLSNTLFNLTQMNSKITLAADQDILNIAFNGKTKKLPNKWNVSSYIFYAKDETYCGLTKKEFLNLKTNPAIVHFDGAKPWSYGNTHPYRNKYFETLRKTKFADFRPKFDVSELLNNSFFFISTFFINHLPKTLYDFFVSLYLKNNFLEKRLHEIEKQNG